MSTGSSPRAYLPVNLAGGDYPLADPLPIHYSAAPLVAAAVDGGAAVAAASSSSSLAAEATRVCCANDERVCCGAVPPRMDQTTQHILRAWRQDGFKRPSRLN